ncbi:sigma 54-interacting transcriptional regulator [Peptostreptococcaceae bacterium AGR-M142]
MDKFIEGLSFLSENIDDGVIIVDNNSVIVNINNSAINLLDININPINKYIKDVIKESLMPEILKSKNEHENQKWNKNKKNFVVTRKLLKNDGKIIGAIAVFKDITMYNKLNKKIDEDTSYINTLNTLLDTSYDWAVVVDRNYKITMMSKGYKEFLGVQNPVGKDVREVIDNTRLHLIIDSGITEIGEIQEIRGQEVVSMRIPIIKEGKVVGAIGKVMFKDLNDFYVISEKVRKLKEELKEYEGSLKSEKSAKYSFEHIIGSSSIIKEVKYMGEKASKTNSNVLIMGESGTGKELFAHAIHNRSKRVLEPFVKINCGAIPSELLESELFGYEEGAFTGAKKGGKKGKFELADKGTIFLDEIGDMPLTMQVKLLRVIQEREVERVGGNKLKKIDVRIIAATNKNLEELVRKNLFREDLYYRLNVMTLNVPPLRSRKEDISLLADFLKSKLSRALNKYVEGISREAIKYLMNYNWPGNVRELENIIERAINLLDSDLIIKPKHLPSRIVTSDISNTYGKTSTNLKEIIEDIEYKLISKYLNEFKGNKNKVAKTLGISRTSLYKKIEKYNIE